MKSFEENALEADDAFDTNRDLLIDLIYDIASNEDQINNENE